MNQTATPESSAADMHHHAPPGWHPPRRQIGAWVAIILIALAALAAVLTLWGLPPFAGSDEQTENAYVRGRTTVIAPQTSGYVIAVLVGDYSFVHQGQILVRIDDAIYRARVAQARASLDAQLAALANSQQARASRSAGVVAQAAGLGNAQAQLLKARADMARADDLVRDGSISIREKDQTLAALRAAEAQVRQEQAAGDIAREDGRTVDVGRGGLQAQVKVARATLRLAEIDLDHTVIRAPQDGQVGEISVRLGQYVTLGTQLFSLVPPERWIIANYKGAQTGTVRVGNPARFTVDALANTGFTGHVEQISPAAGSEFAVLKPDNATGNFVKVPQRIGIRIAIDPHQPRAADLRPGMSVDVRIYTGAHR